MLPFLAPSSALFEQFIQDGYLRVERAFPADLATECRTELWKHLPERPDQPSTWLRPVVRVGERSERPFREAANTPLLRSFYDALVGEGRWLPRGGLGTSPSGSRAPGSRATADGTSTSASGSSIRISSSGERTGNHGGAGS